MPGDRAIKGEIAKGGMVIELLDVDCIQPAGVNARLDSKLPIFGSCRYPFCVDVEQSMEYFADSVGIGEAKPFLLNASESVLASTPELVTLPDDMVARLVGKSSLDGVGALGSFYCGLWRCWMSGRSCA